MTSAPTYSPDLSQLLALTASEGFVAIFILKDAKTIIY